VLDDVGARVVVDEKFYVEPAEETPPNAERGMRNAEQKERP
jgi:hypothetical protein